MSQTSIFLDRKLGTLKCFQKLRNDRKFVLLAFVSYFSLRFSLGKKAKMVLDPDPDPTRTWEFQSDPDPDPTLKSGPAQLYVLHYITQTPKIDPRFRLILHAYKDIVERMLNTPIIMIMRGNWDRFLKHYIIPHK